MLGEIGKKNNQSDKSKLPTNTDTRTKKPARKKRFNRVIQAIKDLQQWIKRVFRSEDNSKKLSSRKIGNIKIDYIKPTETIKLTSAEFKKILKNGTFSNTTKYIVTGDVNLNKYSCYYLPQHIKIIGNLAITNSPKLKCFPYNLEVTGNAKVDNCKNFDIINNDKYKFKCGGKLTLSNLASLTQLPQQADFDVYVYKCKKFRQLSAGNYQNVTIEKCGNFNIINNDIYKFKPCCKLTLINLASLTQLPGNLDSDVYVYQCKNFRQLLAGNYQNVTIEECNNFSIIETPSNIKELSLISNKKFVELPDNLTVGDLIIISCPIKSLVNEVTIEGGLLLKDLTKLTNIYKSKVKLVGELIIDNCSGFLNKININGWPKWVVKHNPDGTVDTNLRRVKINKYHKKILIDARLDIFPVNYIINNFKIFNFTLGGICKFFIQLAEDKNRTSYPYVNYKNEMSSTERGELSSFLKKIEETSDFRSGNKSYLATQIVKILPLFEQGIDEDTYAQAMEIVYFAISTCEDRTILALDDLLILLQAKEAIESGDFEKFKQTVKNNIIIGIMDLNTMKNTDYENEDEDEIENVLESRFYVRKALKISSGIQSKKYCGDISGWDIELKLLEAVSVADAEVAKIKPSDIPSSPTAITPEELIKKQKTLTDYNALTNIIEVDEIPACEITGDNSDKMIQYEGHFYTYDTFLKQYQQWGKDPFTNLPINEKEIYKVVKKANPS